MAMTGADPLLTFVSPLPGAERRGRGRERAARRLDDRRRWTRSHLRLATGRTPAAIDPGPTPARVGLAASAQDRPGDPIRVVGHLGVPEPQDLEAVPSEVGLAPRIVRDLIGVDSAVEFHHEGGFETEEVHDEGADRLPGPLQTVEAASTQDLPQARFGLGLVAPEAPRPVAP